MFVLFGLTALSYTLAFAIYLQGRTWRASARRDRLRNRVGAARQALMLAMARGDLDPHSATFRWRYFIYTAVLRRQGRRESVWSSMRT